MSLSFNINKTSDDYEDVLKHSMSSSTEYIILYILNVNKEFDNDLFYWVWVLT